MFVELQILLSLASEWLMGVCAPKHTGGPKAPLPIGERKWAHLYIGIGPYHFFLLLEWGFQLNLRRVQSTGVVLAKHSPRSLVVAHKQTRKQPSKEKKLPVFHAKPVRAEQNPPHNSYQGIFCPKAAKTC